MRNVAYFYLAGEESGYVVVPAGRRAGPPTSFAPSASRPRPGPGPTLALQIVRHARFHRTGLTARIAPAAGIEQAAEAAKGLRSARRRSSAA